MRQSTFLRHALLTLVGAGWTLESVDDGEQVVPVISVKHAMAVVKAVDMANVYVVRDGVPSFLTVVWQGPDVDADDAEEVVSDYGMKLDDVLAPLFK